MASIGVEKYISNMKKQRVDGSKDQSNRHLGEIHSASVGEQIGTQNNSLIDVSTATLVSF